MADAGARLRRLHLGCGDRHIAGFVHVDIRPLPHVDVVSGLTSLPMSSGCAALIYASHVLEHFPRHQARGVLAEWRRVLAPGGILRLAVPDFAQLVRVYQGNGGDLAPILGPLVGRQDHPHNFHYNMFDRRSLTALLEDAGYHDVREWDWRHTEHAAVDDFSQAYLPHMQKDTGTLISLNLEAVA